MKRPVITEIAARVIAKRHAEAMGPDWKHEVREEKRTDGSVFVPHVYHKTALIGLTYIPDDGWAASIGLKAETASNSAVLIKSYSDLNRSPRLAALECIYRMTKMIHGFRTSFETIDQVDRAIQRLEWPKKNIPDVQTFDSFWADVGRPPGMTDALWEATKDIAASAWEAKP